MEATNLIERRKDENITRQASLLNLKDDDDDGNDTSDELERQLMQPTKDRYVLQDIFDLCHDVEFIIII